MIYFLAAQNPNFCAAASLIAGNLLWFSRKTVDVFLSHQGKKNHTTLTKSLDLKSSMSNVFCGISLAIRYGKLQLSFANVPIN